MFWNLERISNHILSINIPCNHICDIQQIVVIQQIFESKQIIDANQVFGIVFNPEVGIHICIQWNNTLIVI